MNYVSTFDLLCTTHILQLSFVDNFGFAYHSQDVRQPRKNKIYVCM